MSCPLARQVHECMSGLSSPSPRRDRPKLGVPRYYWCLGGKGVRLLTRAAA